MHYWRDEGGRGGEREEMMGSRGGEGLKPRHIY